MSKDLHGELAEEASSWAAENGEPPAAAAPPDASGPGEAPRPSQQTEAPPATQPVSSSSSDRKTDDVDDEQLDEDDIDLGPEDVAELAVALLDIGMTNFVGEHMALKPEQEKRLVRLSTKVAKKWLPEVEGAIEPEWALAAGLLLTYAPKYMSGPGKKPAPTASGGGQTPGSSTPGQTTPASVDGRQVTAEVIP